MAVVKELAPTVFKDPNADIAARPIDTAPPKAEAPVDPSTIRIPKTVNGVEGQVGSDGKWRPNDPADVAPKAPAPVSAGGGGGGGGGSPKPEGPEIGEGGYHADPAVGAELNELLKTNIMDRLAGKNPSYSKEILALQKQKLFESTSGAQLRGRMALYADAARRGIFKSGVTSKNVLRIEREGLKAYTSGVRDLLIEKARSDHKDMLEAVQGAQIWLNGLRQYELGREQNSVAREAIKAQIEAAHIQARATMAAASMAASASRYAADQGLAGARAAAGAAKFATMAGLYSRSNLTNAGQPKVVSTPIGNIPWVR